MTLDDFSIEGKTAIVTGSARGIGKAIALTLAEAGADVVVADIRDEIEETRKEVEAQGQKCLAVKTDVRDDAQVQAMVQATVDTFGKVDILVANAGVERVKPLRLVDGQPPTPMRVQPKLDSGLTEEDWDFIMDVNVRGYVRCARAVGEHMLKQRSGKIIAIGSGAGIRGGANTTAYATSKAGVHRFTQSLAQEWGSFNINVNAIAPGAYGPTEIWDHEEWNIPREEQFANLDIFMQYVPMQRWGVPRELGLQVVFLASEASSYITGQVICSDGGLIL